MTPPGALNLSDDEKQKLLEAMDWVIPTDSSPGAGTEVCLAHLVELVESLGHDAISRFCLFFPSLSETDLDDTRNDFAQEFIEYVRNCYYGYPDTAAWNDVGFRVTS